MSYQFTKSVIDNRTKKVRSLQWFDNGLVDWCQQGARWELNGEFHESNYMTTYPFDQAIISPSGNYTCQYTGHQTKGLIRRADDRKLVREINRSYYFAGQYEYPVAFAMLGDGREVIIHCPEEYNRLEIEEIETGTRIGYTSDTAASSSASNETNENGDASRDPSDIFHSRLAISPSGKWLLSNGWYWHPHETAELFELQKCVEDAHALDRKHSLPPGTPMVQSAMFLEDDRLMLLCDEQWLDREGNEVKLKSDSTPIKTVAIWEIGSKAFDSVSHFSFELGTLMPLDSQYCVAFFEHPKLIHLESGNVVQEWPEIKSGKQTSCICGPDSTLPIAKDPIGRRFAVWSDESIHVVQFSPEDG